MTPVPLSDLSRLPVAIDPAAIEAAFAPFTAPGGDAQWDAAFRQRRNGAIKRAFSRFLGLPSRSARRDAASITSEYEEAWSRGYDRFALARSDLKPVPWTWAKRKLLLDPAAAARMRSVMLGAILADLKPASVLEVGSGPGINLLALAGAYPDVAFTGLELTDAGVAASRGLQASGLPPHLASYFPLPQKDPDAFKRIDFVQGNAAAMPFPDNSFDLVLTVLAVEQMERIRPRALAEIARVARRHVLMLEPFRDINATGLRRLYVYGRDYFRGSIAELRGYGLKPLWATVDFPQEAFLGTALVLGEKS